MNTVPGEAAPVNTRGNPRVRFTTGEVEGFWQTPSSAAFLGVPFAEPPVGDLRFAAPVPRAPWNGVRKATEYGPTPQLRPMAEVTAIPEPSIPGDDTLLVNVFTPRPGDTDAKLPVYVWIHGGGFTAGSPASPWYNGRAFNRDGVVTVTVSYRLGLVGFGYLDGAPANRGVLDWLLALNWVRDNIAHFGGNPADVTIGGQSAGGSAVLTLLACPTAQGLFHKAVAHSAVFAVTPVELARSRTAAIAAKCGVEPTVAGFRDVPDARIVDAQDALTAKSFAANPTAMLRSLIHRGPPTLCFTPVPDGQHVVGHVVDQLAVGAGADKPLLLGATANEFNNVTANSPRALNLIPAGAILRRCGLSRDAARRYAAHHRGKKTSVILGQFVTDMTFHVPILDICAAHRDTWAFTFTWTPLCGSNAGQSPHCLDLPFAWDCLDDEHVEANTGPNPPQKLANAMHRAIVRFIKTGEPGWERFAPPDFVGGVFGATPGPRAGVYNAARHLRASLPMAVM